MKYLYFLIIITITNTVSAELLKPSPDLLPEDIVSIQLTALKNNNFPYENSGIKQTWEFAHPLNKVSTGPLSNFINMMYSNEYSIILNHQDHNIILVKFKYDLSYFFIEIIDKSGNKFGFQWTVKKFHKEGKLKNCWMTIAVSTPILLSKSA